MVCSDVWIFDLVVRMVGFVGLVFFGLLDFDLVCSDVGLGLVFFGCLNFDLVFSDVGLGLVLFGCWIFDLVFDGWTFKTFQGDIGFSTWFSFPVLRVLIW